MWLLMADQLQKGQLNHPLLMLSKGADEKGMMPEELKGSVKAMPSVWAQMIK
jgi:hypothetical protein